MVKCIHCGYIAKSNLGLLSHVRFKHKPITKLEHKVEREIEERNDIEEVKKGILRYKDINEIAESLEYERLYKEELRNKRIEADKFNKHKLYV